MALAPCLLGYGAVAKMLDAHAETRRDEGNTYWPWIQNYTADDYVEAVRLGSRMLLCPPWSPSFRIPPPVCHGITSADDFGGAISVTGGSNAAAVAEPNRRVGQDIHSRDKGASDASSM